MLNGFWDKSDREVYHTFCMNNTCNPQFHLGSFGTNLIGKCTKLSAKITLVMLNVIWDKSDRELYQTFCIIFALTIIVTLGLGQLKAGREL